MSAASIREFAGTAKLQENVGRSKYPKGETCLVYQATRSQSPPFKGGGQWTAPDTEPRKPSPTTSFIPTPKKTYQGWSERSEPLLSLRTCKGNEIKVKKGVSPAPHGVIKGSFLPFSPRGWMQRGGESGGSFRWGKSLGPY